MSPQRPRGDDMPEYRSEGHHDLFGHGQPFGAGCAWSGFVTTLLKHLTIRYLRSNHSCGATLDVFAIGIEVD
jgi:hypothetical protein